MSRLTKPGWDTGTDIGGWVDQIHADFFGQTWWNMADWVLWAPDGGFGDRRDQPVDDEVSVGSEDILPVSTDARIELSDLVIDESSGWETPLPTEDGELIWQYIAGGLWYIVGEDPNVTYTDAEKLALEGAIAAPVTTTVPNAGEGMADFFDDLGDVFTDWLSSELIPNPFVADPGVITTQPVGTTTAAPGAGQKGMVYKQVCGVWKWVPKKRRRRRALLTEADFNALLRIENLKVNKNVTMAISKAITR